MKKYLKPLSLVLVAATCTATAALVLEHQLDALQTKITMDTSPPDRDGPLGGMAGIVENAVPSVVSIHAVSKPERKIAFQWSNRSWMMPFPLEELTPMPAPKQEGMGSGVILTDEGYLVTNDHVIRDADEILVHVRDHKEPYKATVVGRDEPTDLALLKIEAENLKPAVVGDSAHLKPGDTVLALGNPFGLSETVTSGIVSAVGRKDLNITAYSDFIQTDASINPGNSGGALIDNKGRLVGINTAIFSRNGGNMGIGFAIPSNMMRDIVDRLERDGEVRRGYLGVMLSDLTPKLARGFGIEAAGVLVNEVQEGTPAEKAGLMAGDVILNYADMEVTDMAALRLKVANTMPGTKVDMVLLRDGKKESLEVNIGELPERGFARHSTNRSAMPEEPESPLLAGIRVGPLQHAHRMRLGMEDGEQGVVVLSVEAGTAAYEAGLRAGHVIQRVGQVDVKDLEHFADLASEHEGDVILFHVRTERGMRFLAIERDEAS